ncbi:helix-turn-helix domain-containing protein [Nocardia brevicatena]|uniref:helix-turn-helix domain-containing protein n=1 Tax=Nocardia brevicatena TaxID=37327 RepID=UPI00031A2757|nr:helix-turn-helix transcriptional regulator [Nocardia brevicatena]
MEHMSPHHAGKAIARERKLAGLSQQQLANRLVYSVSLLRAVEQGRRVASPALLAKAARVLRVEPEQLTGTPYRDTIEQDGPLEGSTELRAILAEGAYVEPVEPWPLERLQAELNDIDRAYFADQGRVALARLPEVIRRLYGVLHEASDTARVCTMLSQAFLTAERLCRRFGFTSLAPSVIDRLEWTAERADDPLYGPQALIKRARILMYYDRADLGLNLIERGLNSISGEGEGVDAVRGSAHLTGAIIAARGFRPDVAEDHLREARRIAAPMRHESDAYGTLFGPVNVGIHTAAVALESGDPGKAAHEGSNLTLPRKTAPPRAGHHWQDVSRAWLMIGKPDQALAALNRARLVAPQQTKLHPSVRETVYGIAAAQRRRSEGLVGFASWLGTTL